MLKAAMKTSAKLIVLGLLSAWTIQPLHAQVSTGAGLSAQTVATWTSVTAQNTDIRLIANITPTAMVAFNVTGSISGGVITFEVTTAPDGNSNWQQAVCYRMGATPQVDQTYTLTGANQMWQCPAAGVGYFRVRLSTVITGTGTANLTLNGTSGFPSTIATIGEKTARWQVNTPSNATPSASRAAGAAGVRHVADCVSFALAATGAVAATALTVNLRDGATGAGTVIWQQVLEPLAAAAGPAGYQPFGLCGLNIPGSPATAMTLEILTGAANLVGSVALSGYDTQ